MKRILGVSLILCLITLAKNVLTFMLGYGNVGDAGPSSTFLFDDIQQTDSSGNTGIEALEPASEIRCFPNPAQDRLTVVSDGSPIREIVLFDQLGNPVMYGVPNRQTAEVDVADLASGVYFVRVSSQKGVWSIQVLVE